MIQENKENKTNELYSDIIYISDFIYAKSDIKNKAQIKTEVYDCVERIINKYFYIYKENIFFYELILIIKIRFFI